MPISIYNFLTGAFIVFATILLGTVLSTSALAQEEFPIHLSDALSEIIPVIFAAIAAAVSFVAFKVVSLINSITKKAGIELDTNVRGYLETALHSAIAWAEKKALQHASNIEDPTIRSKVVADAVNYMIETVPDALKHFGISNDQLIKMIEARMPAQAKTPEA